MEDNKNKDTNEESKEDQFKINTDFMYEPDTD